MTSGKRLKELFSELGYDKYFDFISCNQKTGKGVVRCRECGNTFERYVKGCIYTPKKNGLINCKTCGLKADGTRNIERYLQYVDAGSFYEDGASVRETAERFGVTISEVNNYVKKNGLTNGKDWHEQANAENKRRHEDAIIRHPGILTTKKHSHRAIKFGCEFQTGISLRKLIDRDGLVCRICGKECDMSDKTYGTHGPLYPSVDHIIPLAKGGAHSWSNVQIAHCMCNSQKGANYEV